MKEYPYREDRDNIQELLKQYERLRRGQGNSFLEEEAFEKIILYFEDREEIPKALEAADRAVEQYPYSANLLIRKADVLLACRRYNDALEVLDRASLFDSGDINIYILRTDAYLALDMQERAAQQLQEALDLFEGEERLELLFELSDVYDDYEEFEKVFDCLKMILELDPNNEEALYKICFWTDFTGRNEESIRLHLKIIDDYPYNELAWFNLAAAYQGLKLYEKAIDAYQYALAIDEKFDYAYRNMGDAFIRLRKYREAIEALEKVTELAKPELVIYEAIGHCYDRLRNFAQARFYYRKASHLNQEDSKLYYKIACTYFNEGQWESCIKQLDMAIRIHRMQPEYHLLMGECRMQMNQLPEAIESLLIALNLRPRHMRGWECLIRCLFVAGMYDEALQHVETALEMTKGKPVFLYYQAAILMASKARKQGLLILEDALQAAPKLLKKFMELYPASLQEQSVVDLIARYKRKRG